MRQLLSLCDSYRCRVATISPNGASVRETVSRCSRGPRQASVGDRYDPGAPVSIGYKARTRWTQMISNTVSQATAEERTGGLEFILIAKEVKALLMLYFVVAVTLCAGGSPFTFDNGYVIRINRRYNWVLTIGLNEH